MLSMFLFGRPLLNPDCPVPKIYLFAVVLQNLILFGLFSNFYYRTYCVKQRVTNKDKWSTFINTIINVSDVHESEFFCFKAVVKESKEKEFDGMYGCLWLHRKQCFEYIPVYACQTSESLISVRPCRQFVCYPTTSEFLIRNIQLEF